MVNIKIGKQCCNDDTGKVCFAQSSPVLQAPKSNTRDARLFITFRPGEKITNEISVTAGYEFNNKNSVTANQEKININLILHKKVLLGLQIIN